jgi:hypothetical protein
MTYQFLSAFLYDVCMKSPSAGSALVEMARGVPDWHAPIDILIQEKYVLPVPGIRDTIHSNTMQELFDPALPGLFKKFCTMNRNSYTAGIFSRSPAIYTFHFPSHIWHENEES